MREWADLLLGLAINGSLLVLSLAFLITVARVILGPSLPDRVLGLDALVSIAIGFIAVIGIKTGFALYVDIAIALGLVGFLATVAFARFIHMRGKTEEEIEDERRAAARERAAVRSHATASGPGSGSGPRSGSGPGAGARP